MKLTVPILQDLIVTLRTIKINIIKRDYEPYHKASHRGNVDYNLSGRWQWLTISKIIHIYQLLMTCAPFFRASCVPRICRLIKMHN